MFFNILLPLLFQDTNIIEKLTTEMKKFELIPDPSQFKFDFECKTIENEK